MRKAKSLSARPGADMSPTFSLLNHVDEILTVSQWAERLVEYFSKISKEFVPIEEDTLNVLSQDCHPTHVNILKWPNTQYMKT